MWSLSSDYVILCSEIVQYHNLAATCNSFLANYSFLSSLLSLCDKACHPISAVVILGFVSIILALIIIIKCNCCPSKQQAVEQPLPNTNNNNDNNNCNHIQDNSNSNNNSNISHYSSKDNQQCDQPTYNADDDRSYLSFVRSKAWLLAPYRTPSKGGSSASLSPSQSSTGSSHSNSNDSSPSGYDSDDILPPQFDDPDQDHAPSSNNGSPSPQKRHRRKWTHTVIQSPQEVVKEARIHRKPSEEDVSSLKNA